MLSFIGVLIAIGVGAVFLLSLLSGVKRFSLPYLTARQKATK